MNLIKLRRGQEGLGSVLRWILYLAILVAAIFGIRSIFFRAVG